jgi:hypothetical protein
MGALPDSALDPRPDRRSGPPNLQETRTKAQTAFQSESSTFVITNAKSRGEVG